MMKPQLTPKDWQLLSEYLDGQLAQRDQAKLEQRLKKQPELQNALTEMRQMRQVLRAVPRKKVPHNFTLTHNMVAEQQQSTGFLHWIPALSLSSALATLILVVSLLLGGTPALSGAARVTEAPAQPQALLAPKAAGQAAAPTAEGTQPPILLWNGTNGATGSGGGPAYGRGGGGGGGGEGGSGQPIEPPASALAAPDLITPPPSYESPAVPNIQTATPESAPQALAQAPSNSAPSEGSGPILGIAPKADQGKITNEQPAPSAEAVQPASEMQPKGVSGLLAAQIGLAVIAIAAAIGALLLWLKSRS